MTVRPLRPVSCISAFCFCSHSTLKSDCGSHHGRTREQVSGANRPAEQDPGADPVAPQAGRTTEAVSTRPQHAGLVGTCSARQGAAYRSCKVRMNDNSRHFSLLEIDAVYVQLVSGVVAQIYERGFLFAGTVWSKQISTFNTIRSWFSRRLLRSLQRVPSNHTIHCGTPPPQLLQVTKSFFLT